MQKAFGLAYTAQGQGVPLILIHGFCETHTVWAEISDDLAQHCTVYCVDLPGFGNSASITPPFSIDDVADKVYRWIEGLKIQQPIIVGHSLGGYVTLSLMERYENSFNGFGLFHSTAYADTEEKKVTRGRVIDFVKEYGVRYFAESFIPQLFYQRKDPGIKEAAKQVTEIAAKTPLASVVDYTIAMRDRPGREGVLQHTNKPVLFVAGEKDTTVPIEKSREQAHLPQYHQTFFLDNTGHMGMFEKRIESISIFKQFIDYCSGFLCMLAIFLMHCF